MESMAISNMSSPVGRLRLAATDGGACLVAFVGGRGRDPAQRLADQWGCTVTVGTNRHLRQLREQLAAYFRGTLQQFTLSYGELARRIGRPKAQRAVGQATGANPLTIVVPCHRVLDSSGRLHGYGGGLRRKRLLLELEGAWTSTRE
jgi:O-6-methylguanine DNA methyltransferase